MEDSSKHLCNWFSDWFSDIHPDVYLRGLEVTDVTTALLTKERMTMALFDRPAILHVPISCYSDHKRRLFDNGTFRDVMLSIHFF